MLRQKLKHMIAMSTVISVVTASTMKLKMDYNDHSIVQQMYKKIESDPNYPTILSTIDRNQMVNLEQSKNISKKLYSSKLVQLLDHLLLMNICVSDEHILAYQTICSRPVKIQFRDITLFKHLVFYNYLTAASCMS